jgi:hypothetical protein
MRRIDGAASSGARNMAGRPTQSLHSIERLLGAPDLSARSRSLILLAAIFACALRAVLLARFANPSSPELWEFGTIARNLVETGVYSFHVPGVPSAYMPPGYPLLIAGLYATLGIGPAAHYALGALLLAFECLVPLLVGLLALRLWGAAAGRTAFVLSLYWPQFLLLSGRYHSLPISLALLLLALGALWSERWSLARRAAVCGLLLGLYGLFRMELAAILAPFLYGLWREGAALPGGPVPRARRLGAALLCVACCAAVVSPWIVRNRVVFGRFVLGTSGGYNLLRGHNENATGGGRNLPGDEERDILEIPPRIKALEPDFRGSGDELVADALYRREALAYIRANPGREASLAAIKGFFFLVADFTHPIQRRWVVWLPSLLALVLGFAWWLRRGALDPRQQTLWLVFAVNAALAMIFFVLPRYRMAVEFVPVLFLASWLASRLKGPARPSS